MVNFSPVLEWKIIPLCEILNELLALGEKALGCPVEIEFAVNIFKDSTDKSSEFYLSTNKTYGFNYNKNNFI